MARRGRCATNACDENAIRRGAVWVGTTDVAADSDRGREPNQSRRPTEATEVKSNSIRPTR